RQSSRGARGVRGPPVRRRRHRARRTAQRLAHAAELRGAAPDGKLRAAVHLHRTRRGLGLDRHVRADPRRVCRTRYRYHERRATAGSERPVRGQTGRASAWVSFGGNAETAADFATVIPEPPLAPTALGQFQNDGVTAIPVGGSGRSRSAVFKGTVTDPNPSDVVRLEVEVEPLGTAFTGVPNGSGAAVANGTIATATVACLTDNVSY